MFANGSHTLAVCPFWLVVLIVYANRTPTVFAWTYGADQCVTKMSSRSLLTWLTPGPKTRSGQTGSNTLIDEESLTLKRTLKNWGMGVKGPPKFRVRESKDSQIFGPEGTLASFVVRFVALDANMFKVASQTKRTCPLVPLKAVLSPRRSDTFLVCTAGSSVAPPLLLLLATLLFSQGHGGQV